MRQSRRMFLGSLGAGITFLSLPEISPVLGWLSPAGGANEELTDTIYRLLLEEGAGGPFVARAEAKMYVGPPHQVLPAASGLLKMLDSHGFGRSFGSNVNNDAADQCREQFERQEDHWRRRGFQAFTKVHRSAADNHVAFSVGGNIDSNSNLVEAAGATQYQDSPAVPLVKHDPVSLLVGKWLTQRNLTPQEVARTLAPTEKKDVTLDSGQVATRYETPASAVVYVPQPRQGSGVQHSVGVVAVNLKKDPQNIYISDLLA